MAVAKKAAAQKAKPGRMFVEVDDGLVVTECIYSTVDELIADWFGCTMRKTFKVGNPIYHGWKFYDKEVNSFDPLAQRTFLAYNGDLVATLYEDGTIELQHIREEN